MGWGRDCDWVTGCGFLRSWVVFLPLFTLFGGNGAGWCVYGVLWHRGLDPFPGRWLLWLASVFVSAAFLC